MSVFSIILLCLLGAYVVIVALDKFFITPKREWRTLPEVNRRLDEIEKKLNDLIPSDVDLK